jgi:DNA-binding response OmpR family regulator
MSTPARRVLIVDDDPAIQRVLSQTLQLEGHEITIAGDGQEAIDKLDGYLPDVVILDVMMPRMNGYEVLAKIRSDQRTANLPVILLTAKSSIEDVWQGWHAGVDYYMTKPFDVEELLRFLEFVFAGGEQPPPD